MSAARRLLSQWAPAVRCPGELSVASQWCRGYAAEAALAEPMDMPEHEKDGKVLHPGAHPAPVAHIALVVISSCLCGYDVFMTSKTIIVADFQRRVRNHPRHVDLSAEAALCPRHLRWQ